MATTSFREQFTTFALVGLLVFSAIFFIVLFQQNNGVTNTILQDQAINNSFGDLNDTLSTFGSNAQTQRENFESDIPERGFGALIIFAIVGVGQKFTGMMIGVYNILIKIPSQTLGINPIIPSILGAIVIVTLIVMAWRLYRVGD